MGLHPETPSVYLPLSPRRSPCGCHESGDKVLPGAVVAEEDAALDPPDPPGVQPPGSAWTRLPGRDVAASQHVTYLDTSPP